MSTAIGRWPIMIIDCPDARALAGFYSAITGWPLAEQTEPEWVQLNSGHSTTIGFQQVTGYRAPTWPSQEVPQQAHLDFVVDDLAEASAQVLAIGATEAPYQYGSGYRIFLDPAGHPFCLVAGA